jgi:hypothetical protein
MSTPASSIDLGSATWEVMHLEGVMYSIQEAMVHDNGLEVRRLMEQAQIALEGLKDNREALALLEKGPFNESSRRRLFHICSERYPTTQSQQNNLTKCRQQISRNGKAQRGVLRLRGGGEGEEKAKEVLDPRTPRLRPDVPYKIFYCLDDPVISIGIILVNLISTICGFLVKSEFIDFLGDFTLYVMVAAQTLEIFLHSTWAKRMLEEKSRIRVVTLIDPADAYPIDVEGMFVPGKKGQKTKIIQGSEGMVVMMRERRLRPQKIEDGAFVQLDGNSEKLFYLPWYRYKDVIIISNLKDYFSDWMNTFNTLLLAFCVISLYVFKAGKAAAAMRVFLIVLRVIRPVLRLGVSSQKVSKFDGELGGPEVREETEDLNRDIGNVVDPL